MYVSRREQRIEFGFPRLFGEKGTKVSTMCMVLRSPGLQVAGFVCPLDIMSHEWNKNKKFLEFLETRTGGV